MINASTWVLIVIILEADDWIKSRFETDIRLAMVLNFAKVTLYSFLLGCAIFWGFSGVFLDFWDAFLWIVAFAFIELNVFDYRDKTSG